MGFESAFQDMERNVTKTLGSGPGTDNRKGKILFNGIEVDGTLTPIELTQPFTTDKGSGRTDTPSCTIAIAKELFVKHGQVDPRSNKPDLSRNRFTIVDASGTQQMRVLRRGNDLLSGDVQLYCGPVDT